MLTVRDLTHLPDLELAVAAGADGLGNTVTWLHVSELTDPTGTKVYFTVAPQTRRSGLLPGPSNM